MGRSELVVLFTIFAWVSHKYLIFKSHDCVKKIIIPSEKCYKTKKKINMDNYIVRKAAMVSSNQLITTSADFFCDYDNR